MTIYEFADIIQTCIVWTYYPNQKGRISVSFEGVEVKEGRRTLVKQYGNGFTLGQALGNYITMIKGKIIVINANSSKRREYGVPETFTGSGE